MHIWNSLDHLSVMAKATKHYGRQIEPVCQRWELTRNEMDVLLFLYNNPRYDRAADIVSLRRLSKSHVSLSVSNLERRGMLEKRYDPGDRRVAHLQLTGLGREAAEKGSRIQMDYFAWIFQGLTQEEIAHWQKILRKVAENIENMEE